MTMFLETVTGQLIDVANPDPATIKIEDIGWGLSRLPRFAGHTITAIPYNGAQHSIFVADEIPLLRPFLDHEELQYMNPFLPLYALIHNAAESYTGDLPSPIKYLPELRPIIKEIEHKLMMAIYESLGLPPLHPGEEALIKKADKIAQKIEAHAFMPSRGRHWPG